MKWQSYIWWQREGKKWHYWACLLRDYEVCAVARLFLMCLSEEFGNTQLAWKFFDKKVVGYDAKTYYAKK